MYEHGDEQALALTRLHPDMQTTGIYKFRARAFSPKLVIRTKNQFSVFFLSLHESPNPKFAYPSSLHIRVKTSSFYALQYVKTRMSIILQSPGSIEWHVHCYHLVIGTITRAGNAYLIL